MTSIEDILARPRARRESSVTLCLAGDLVAAYEDLQDRLDGASEAVDSLGDVSPAAAIRQQLADLAGEMVSGSETFWLRALPANDWSDVNAQQPGPPKSDEGTDEVSDEAAAAFRADWHAWVCQILAGTCYEPAMTVEQADQLFRLLSNTQWDELTEAAYQVNTGKPKIPFSVAAFAKAPATTPKSKRPTKSASRARSSSAGS